MEGNVLMARIIAYDLDEVVLFDQQDVFFLRIKIEGQFDLEARM